MNRMQRTGKWLAFTVTALLAVAMTTPFLYMLTTSVKTLEESLQYPPVWIPGNPAWSQYIEIWTRIPLVMWFMNSMIVAVSCLLAQIVICSLAAYAFSFITFRGKSFVFLMILAVLMVPHQVVIIPQFLLMKTFGWLDTYKALILPHTVSAFAIFLFRQYFLTLPSEVIESSKIDGCTPLGSMYRIVLPNAKPIITTMVLVTFLSYWNDFMWPLIVTNSKDMMVLPVGMANMIGEYSTNWPVLMTVATYAMMPVIVLFLFGQRYFIEGMVTTGLKS